MRERRVLRQMEHADRDRRDWRQLVSRTESTQTPATEAEAQQRPAGALNRALRQAARIGTYRQTGIVLAEIVLFLVFTALSPRFLSGYNIINIILQSVVTSLLAVGETFVIITAGIDLSVGSILAVSAVAAGLLLTHGTSFAIVLIVPLLIGALAGLVNGLIITLIGITPFIATLGTMSIYAGIALILAGGQTVYGIPQSFEELLGGYLGPIPIPVLVLLVVLLLAAAILKYTKLGEYAIAIGGNAEVARLAGINLSLYTSAVYVVAGILCALGGMISVARLGAADPIAGSDLLLPAIAAAVMGGANLMGGEGSMLGAVVGALLISTLQAGLTFLNVQAFYQEVAVGIVIILALALNRFQKGFQNGRA
jgi:ribose transport system permease protein